MFEYNSRSVIIYLGNKDEKESKKKLALKLLALKVAAYMKWDLNKFEKKYACFLIYVCKILKNKITIYLRDFYHLNVMWHIFCR